MYSVSIYVSVSRPDWGLMFDSRRVLFSAVRGLLLDFRGSEVQTFINLQIPPAEMSNVLLISWMRLVSSLFLHVKDTASMTAPVSGILHASSWPLTATSKLNIDFSY